jgi:hypothetical protein
LYHKSHILPGNLTTTRRIKAGHPQINDSFLDQLGQWTAAFSGIKSKFFIGVQKFSKNQEAT